jgi:hypothetical protein
MECTLEKTTTNENNLLPFLRGMLDEQQELQMNVGKAMDALQKDYPYFLRRAPVSCPLFYLPCWGSNQFEDVIESIRGFDRIVSPNLTVANPIPPPSDYSIYHDFVSMKASDGQVQLSYKKAFGIARTMLSLLYDVDRSVVQSRMVYDSPRMQIRISFNTILMPRTGLLNSLGGRTVHVDRTSVY